MLVSFFSMGPAMKKLLIITISLSSLIFTPTLARASEVIPSSMPVGEKSLDYSKTYTDIRAQAESLGGMTANNVRYSTLSQILMLSLDDEQTVIALANIQAVAVRQGDKTMVSVFDDLRLANGNKTSDISAILSGKQGLPPIPTPPSAVARNSSSSDY